MKNYLPAVLVMLTALAVSCSNKPQEDDVPKPHEPTPKAEIAPEAEPLKTEPSSGEELVPLQLELPNAMFMGTPPDIKASNLEPSLKSGSGKRAPIMVPKGVVNVALDKEVSGSDDLPVVGDLELITDGDKEGSDGSYVELGPLRQHVQIDLEESYTIYAIVVWHFHSQARVYKDVVVQVADDPDFITNVRTVFNNDHDNSIGLGTGKDKEWIETRYGRPIAVNKEKARYVRLYSNGSTSSEMNHYIEVEVYGK